MMYNTKVDKRHKMINPDKLFTLPQDRLRKRKIASELPTTEDTRKFAEQVANLRNKKVFKI